VHRVQTRSGFLATVLTGLLLANGCGGSGAASIPIPPSLPDISGTYLFNFGTGPSGALALTSLTVTLNQTQWLNDINTLTVSSGQLLFPIGLCSGITNQTISIAAHLEWNGQQEKLVLTINAGSGEILSMTDANFVSPYSGTWTPGPAFPSCPGQVAPPYSWTGIKQ
jgi:hypothetical protein